MKLAIIFLALVVGLVMVFLMALGLAVLTRAAQMALFRRAEKRNVSSGKFESNDGA